MIFLINAKKYIEWVLADSLVAKAFKISELTQIAKAEKRLRQFIWVAYDERARQAEKKAIELAKKLESPKTISSEIDKIMNKWQEDIKKVFLYEFEKVYKLGRNVAFKKATKQIKGSLRYGTPKFEEIKKSDSLKEIIPSFTLADKQAIDALKKHQLFWIGDFYKNGVSDEIAKVTREVMAEAGQGSALAGRLMEQKIAEAFSQVKMPKGFIGTPKQYFELLTANAMTVARVHGQIRSFMEIGITRYRINNPMDKRTCERCLLLEGKEFSIQQGAEQMYRELTADSKEAVKKVHPWLSRKQIEKISPIPGRLIGAAGIKDAKNLSDAGQALPPYHGRCRCTVDVSYDSMKYENLSPMIPPTPFSKPRTIELIPPKQKILEQDMIYKKLQTSIPYESERVVLGGIQTEILGLKTNDNKKLSAIFEKDNELAKNRTSYYRVDRELGGNIITPTTVTRDVGLERGVGNLQFFEKLTEKKVDEIKELIRNKKIDFESYRRLRLLDIISQNEKRKTKIYFKEENGRVKFLPIRNSKSFSDKIPKKYEPIFEIENKKLLKFSKKEKELIKKISLKRITKILVEEGIDKKPIILTLFRIQALKNNPNIDLSDNEKITEFWKNIANRPKSYLTEKQINSINKTVEDEYKSK